MPELPEVETISRGLDQRLRNDVIESVWIGKYREPLKSPARKIARALEGARIEKVHRVGKHIVMELNCDSSASHRAARLTSNQQPAASSQQRSVQFIVHLGMSGQLIVAEPAREMAKHTHFVARLRSGRELRFIDPRRFGRLSIRSVATGEAATHWAGGAEPLEVSFEDFAALFRKRKTPIKSALLNQKLLRGVGNIYADEALFRAAIRPRRRAATLTRAELRRLHHALRAVLNEAIAAGGSSISDYVDAAGDEGRFQFEHRVYGREAEPCVECKTAIKRVVLAGRSAHYCPVCQK